MMNAMKPIPKPDDEPDINDELNEYIVSNWVGNSYSPSKTGGSEIQWDKLTADLLDEYFDESLLEYWGALVDSETLRRVLRTHFFEPQYVHSEFDDSVYDEIPYDEDMYNPSQVASATDRAEMLVSNASISLLVYLGAIHGVKDSVAPYAFLMTLVGAEDGFVTGCSETEARYRASQVVKLVDITGSAKTAMERFNQGVDSSLMVDLLNGGS